MRFLVAHNRYRFSGGEDAAVRAEIELLREHGHIVELLEEDNEAIHGLGGRLAASASVFYSRRSRRRIQEAIGDFRPDLLHVHNWFPRLSPSIVLAASAAEIPVVQTLHNFRMVCANGLLFRNGAVCTDCLGKSLPLAGIVHGCYRDSRAGSAIVTAAYGFHRLAHTWDGVDLFIAVSGFAREILIRGGLPAEKIAVKPNFTRAESFAAEKTRENAVLFVGRLSPEKGIRTLLAAWETGLMPLRLKIVGDGPLREEVERRAASGRGIEYLGRQPHEAVFRAMAKARILVFPSACFETFGLTIVEAFAQGTPVLASDHGTARELVEEGATGFRFPPGDAAALAAAVQRFPGGEDYERMSARCREVFLSRFTAEANYARMMEIYARAIGLRRQRR
ncbi:MAG: glycosyltransferase family 4 protein [Terracidiphilus sp.]